MSSSFSTSSSTTTSAHQHQFNAAYSQQHHHQQQLMRQQQQALLRLSKQQQQPANANSVAAPGIEGSPSPSQHHYQHQQMRRVSLPSALQNQQQQSNNGGNRSPRSRTPNSLSPKLGFLKEISEFDIDPPFISPAASSSSSADNSNCTSPMLLSPSAQRPASARLYRRNRNSQPSVLATGGTGSGNNNNSSNSRESPRQRKSSKAAAVINTAGNGPPEDDGFRWTDVDGFYGRKNSIPLQQLLANDLALLNGLELAKKKNGMIGGSPNSWNNSGSCNGTPTKKMSNEGLPPKAQHFLNVFDSSDNNDGNANGSGNNINIPLDITENEDEERVEQQQQHNRMEMTCRERSASHNVRSALHEVKKSSSAPMGSPTKRRLMMLSSRLYSLEDKHKEEEEEEEELGTTPEEEEENGGGGKKHCEVDNDDGGKAIMASGRVKFMDSVEESERNNKAANGIDDDVQTLRRALKARKKRPIAQQFRHFSIDSQGERVVDSGVRTIRAKLHPGQPQQLATTNATNNSNKTAMQSPQTRNQKARRATCPEIWLSVAEDEQRPLMECAVRLFGCTSVGKKCVAKQIAFAAEVAPVEDDIVSIDSEDMQRPYRTVSFLLNEHEVHMEIIQGSLLPENRRGTAAATGGELTIFAVVYSVDNRESFIRAAQILYRLYGDRHGTKQKGAKQKAIDRASVPLILIANKSDLQRKRRVTSIEGKMLAKIYKCPFVEMSALLSANVDTLWREVLRKLFKYLQARERLLQSQENTPDTSNSSPRLMARTQLVGRILERTRRFAKSCEDWIAARIVTI